MLLAAGLGTRLKPFTDKHPKALATVNGKTLLEHNFVYLQQFGIKDIVVNVHHFAEQIIETLHTHNGFGSNFTISDESEMVLETGGGLKYAAQYFKDEDCFLVMNVDILSNSDLSQLIAYHQLHQPLATLAVQDRVSSRNLLFDRTQNLKLIGWKNNTTNEERIPVKDVAAAKICRRAFSGIQVISGAMLQRFTRAGKFSLIDLYLDLCTEYNIIAWEHTGDLLLDVGKPESLLQAEQMFY